MFFITLTNRKLWRGLYEVHWLRNIFIISPFFQHDLHVQTEMYRRLQNQRDLDARAQQQYQRDLDARAQHERNKQAKFTTPATPRWQTPFDTPGAVQIVPQPGQMIQRWPTPTTITQPPMQPVQLVPVVPQNQMQRHPVVYQKPPPSLFPPMHQ